MLIALVNNQRTVATPKLNGLCPGCQEPVTAKCGTQRAWHWAHVSKNDCDNWREETEWHRFWKGHFPLDWQEVILYDKQSGEKHIADVRTHHGLVIEFQHSPLDPQERAIREAFYKNMVWIVDAAHRRNDYKRFVKSFPKFLNTHKKGMYLVPFPEESFPVNCVQSSKPVFFDFRWIAVLIAFNRGDIVAEATEHSDLVQVLLKGHMEANNFLLLSRQQMQQRLSPMLPRNNYYSRFLGRL